jgi:hypothetical protein
MEPKGLLYRICIFRIGVEEEECARMQLVLEIILFLYLYKYSFYLIIFNNHLRYAIVEKYRLISSVRRFFRGCQVIVSCVRDFISYAVHDSKTQYCFFVFSL